MEQKVIKVQGKIPRKVGVAVSSGIDSMSVLDFLRKNHDITVYHFNHGSTNADIFERFIRASCMKMQLPIKVGDIKNPKPKEKSLEEHWRDERYKWLREQDETIVLGHHLDDCVESYIFNMCNGKNYTIPYRHANCIRPFRLTSKTQLHHYALQNKIVWIEDPSNVNTVYKRNFIRYEVMPSILKVNPGLHKVISKRIKEEVIE